MYVKVVAIPSLIQALYSFKSGPSLLYSSKGCLPSTFHQRILTLYISSHNACPLYSVKMYYKPSYSIKMTNRHIPSRGPQSFMFFQKMPTLILLQEMYQSFNYYQKRRNCLLLFQGEYLVAKLFCLF